MVVLLYLELMARQLVGNISPDSALGLNLFGRIGVEIYIAVVVKIVGMAYTSMIGY